MTDSATIGEPAPRLRARGLARRRALVTAAYLAVLASVACRAGEPGEVAAPPPSAGAEALLDLDPERLPDAVRARYRLRPDRRLLTAAGEVARLLTGTACDASAASTTAGRWRLTCGSAELGELSALPEFEEATDLLVAHARPLASGGALDGPDGESGATADFFDLQRALKEAAPLGILDGLARLELRPPIDDSDRAAVRATVSSLAWLAALTPDELEQADALLAQAWAWLALERALQIAGNEGSEALAIRELGYESAAARVAASLPPDDAIRLYVEHREDRLLDTPRQKPGSAASLFLRLSLLAERFKEGQYREARESGEVRGRDDLALLGFDAQVKDFERGWEAGPALAASAFQAVGSCAPGDPSTASARSLAGRTREFESLVASCAARFADTPLGAPAAAAFYRSAFYSGLFAEARFLLRQRGSGPEAIAWAAQLESPAAGAAEGLRRWVETSAAAKDGGGDDRALADLIASSPDVGSAVLLDLAETLAENTSVTDPLRRRPMPHLFADLDSRPAHRIVAARLAEGLLTSPWLYETFARAAADSAPHTSRALPSRAALLREDTQRLREIADDPAMSSSTQISALWSLSKLGQVDDAFVRSRYERIALAPDEGVDHLVEFLEERGDFDGAAAAVAAALERERVPKTIAWAHLRSEAARLSRLQGDAENAWKLIEPALLVYTEEALLEGALTQLARRRFTEAEKLARACVERYPHSSEASGLLARAQWNLEDSAVAAKELASSRNGIVGDWNRYLPEAFASVFVGVPADRARSAFAELVSAGIAPHVLANVAIEFGKQDGIETALPLLENLPRSAPEWKIKIRLDTYDLILDKSGADAANAWYRSHHTRTHDDALTLYQLRRYAQLLALFPEGDESSSPHIVRVVKAASHLHLREVEGARWKGLAREVKGDWGKDDFFVRAARYLLGQADRKAVLESIPDVGHLASVGWAMGVKAASERRFAEAEAWFQVALESGQKQQPPHAWSWQILSDWRLEHRSLELLQSRETF